MQPPNIEFTDLVRKAGQDQVLSFIREFREKHGPEWLAEFRDYYPAFCQIIDLVANHDADEALDVICRDYAEHIGGTFGVAIFRGMYGDTLKDFHALLRHEIDKKR